MSDQSEWVSLGEAAQILGVHPTTVRHWADGGELPSQRTPGGHRRFRRSDLAAWSNLRNRESAPTEARLITQSALGRARLEITEGQMLRHMPWYADLTEADRRAHGMLGRRILELLTRYLAENPDEKSFISEVHEVGREYALLSCSQHIPLSGAVKVFLFFRDVLTDSVIQMSEMLSLRTAGDWGNRLRQINHVTGELLIALVSGYEQTDG